MTCGEQVVHSVDGAQRDTFLVKPGRLRVFVQTVGLVFPAGVFLALAVVPATVFGVEGGLAQAALLLFAVAMVALATFCLLFLSTNLVRIEVGPQTLKVRLPRLRGPLPLPSLIRAEIPYGDIAAVERRDEFYSSFGLVTAQDAYSLVLRDGRRIPLGVLSEHWTKPLPLDAAAERIARRAGLSVRDRGGVPVGGVVRGIVRGSPPWGSETITTPVERKLWHARAIRSMHVLGVMFTVLAVVRACAR